jgi:hypothetical protein
MNAKDRDFQRLARLDQSILEKEISGEEEYVNEIPYMSNAGEGAENVSDRELHAETPMQDRGYRRLDEPNE